MWAARLVVERRWRRWLVLFLGWAGLGHAPQPRGSSTSRQRSTEVQHGQHLHQRGASGHHHRPPATTNTTPGWLIWRMLPVPSFIPVAVCRPPASQHARFDCSRETGSLALLPVSTPYGPPAFAPLDGGPLGCCWCSTLHFHRCGAPCRAIASALSILLPRCRRTPRQPTHLEQGPTAAFHTQNVFAPRWNGRCLLARWRVFWAQRSTGFAVGERSRVSQKSCDDSRRFQSFPCVPCMLRPARTGIAQRSSAWATVGTAPPPAC